MTNMTEQNWKGKLLHFLIYSYWGINSCDGSISNELIRIECAKKAYLDMARTVKFCYSASDLVEKKKGRSDSEKKVAESFERDKKNLVERVCEKILMGLEENMSGQDAFDNWHREKCVRIIKMMNDSGVLDRKTPFTYGQAQKWVNMTLKYLWLLDCLPEGLHEEYLHVPIDSFILQALMEEANVKNISCSGETYRYKGETWSSMGKKEPDKRNECEKCDDYDDLQKIIRDIASIPIDWEGHMWIKVAQRRKQFETS